MYSQPRKHIYIHIYLYIIWFKHTQVVTHSLHFLQSILADKRQLTLALLLQLGPHLAELSQDFCWINPVRKYKLILSLSIQSELSSVRSFKEPFTTGLITVFDHYLPVFTEPFFKRSELSLYVTITRKEKGWLFSFCLFKHVELDKYTPYKLRVAASTAVGQSSLSEEDDVFVHTLEDGMKQSKELYRHKHKKINQMTD